MKKQLIKPEFTEKMFEMLGEMWITGCIKTAAELNIADHLEAGPQTISSLAKKNRFTGKTTVSDYESPE